MAFPSRAPSAVDRSQIRLKQSSCAIPALRQARVGNVLQRRVLTHMLRLRCQHYFCEGCALSNYTKSKRCFICNEQTHDVFNNAKKLIAKIKRCSPD